MTLETLLQYTDWEREQWREWFRKHGDEPLQLSAGPHGDGRFHTIGDLVKHIFFAEKRYVERLTDQPLTDQGSLPAASAEALFEFGRRGRSEFRKLIDGLPAEEWDSQKQFKILNHALSATPRKIVMHVLVHEIRHWAQIGTILRLNGLTGDFHDFLFSPVLGSPR
jgi:uncharacterized damage-inducible protein DinB